MSIQAHPFSRLFDFFPRSTYHLVSEKCATFDSPDEMYSRNFNAEVSGQFQATSGFLSHSSILCYTAAQVKRYFAHLSKEGKAFFQALYKCSLSGIGIPLYTYLKGGGVHYHHTDGFPVPGYLGRQVIKQGK